MPSVEIMPSAIAELDQSFNGKWMLQAGSGLGAAKRTPNAEKRIAAD